MSKKDAIYIGPQQIMEDWGVCRATAYNLIKEMNEQIKKEHPSAITMQGKVNKIWYEEACLKRRTEEENG